MPPPVATSIRREAYNRCNPDESLLPGDDRNVDIDADSTEVRGENWVEELASEIELSSGPTCAFFTGLPGSGKSTELRRLAARLKRRSGAHLLPVRIDAEKVIDLDNPIDVPDLLMAILYKTEEHVLKAEKKDPKDALREGPASRFWHWLTTTEVAFAQIEAGTPRDVPIPVAARVVLGLKEVASLREKVRTTVAAHMTTFIARMHEALADLDRRVQALGYRGLAVIFDSLEKLRGLTANWREVLASAEAVFKSGAPHLRLPVHMVYTIPSALAFRLNVKVTFLPMIKLASREGARSPEGYAAARSLIEKRLPEPILGEIFGPTSRESRIDRLIEWSGGYPREIVRLLQDLVRRPAIDEVIFTKILSRAGDSYRRTVPEDAHAWLARVHVEKALPVLNDDHRETVDRMLSNNVVLRYLNGSEWFDIHPAIRTIPGVAAEIKKLRG